MEITLFTDEEMTDSVNLTLKNYMSDDQLVYFLENTFDNWTFVVIW